MIDEFDTGSLIKEGVKYIRNLQGTEVSLNSTDNINYPPHYNSGPIHSECGKVIECIDVVRLKGFNVGNVIKYLWRAGLKGSVLEDLKKARWYLDDEIKRLENDQSGQKQRDLLRD